MKVVKFQERLNSSNVDRILDQGWDVIVDGFDNFPTRYLVNDASVWHKIPVVHGSIFRFDGQVTTFWPSKGPCYRCLYPEPPPAHLAPSCPEAGVLGILPGIIGVVQATEAIKLILGQGDPLVGRLLTYDSLKMTFRKLKLRRDKTARCAARTRPSTSTSTTKASALGSERASASRRGLPPRDFSHGVPGRFASTPPCPATYRSTSQSAPAGALAPRGKIALALEWSRAFGNEERRGWRER